MRSPGFKKSDCWAFLGCSESSRGKKLGKHEIFVKNKEEAEKVNELHCMNWTYEGNSRKIGSFNSVWNVPASLETFPRALDSNSTAVERIPQGLESRSKDEQVQHLEGTVIHKLRILKQTLQKISKLSWILSTEKAVHPRRIWRTLVKFQAFYCQA